MSAAAEQEIEDLKRVLRRALQFCQRASDWNFDCAEIDGDEVSTRDMIEEIESVLE